MQFLPGGAGPIETIIELPANARDDVFAIVCHPHPLYGGTMHNKVVTTVVRAMRESGIPSLRFNFRGVGQSAGEFAEGEGEAQDLAMIVDWVRDHYSGQIILAGFSFGSYVAFRVASQVNPAVLICIGPPTQHVKFAALPEPSCPWFVIQGDDDEIISAAGVYSWAEARLPADRIIRFADTGHFFHGKLNELQRSVVAIVAKTVPRP